MALHGMAFLPIWHDVAAEAEQEFNQWHTEEHMPERVATPGIAVGRRYANASLDLHRYFTLYEADSFDVFASDGYFATANARSAWTRRMHPHFLNFVRNPCHLVMTRGRGIGGALATVRVILQTAVVKHPALGAITGRDAYGLAVRDIVDTLMQIKEITAVHAGATGQVQRRPLSESSLSLRPNAMAFDGVLLLESIDLATLEACLPRVQAVLQQHLSSFARWEQAAYQLAFHLSDS
ncbi:MAG: hypothetical protein JWP29_2096 [Rhodoferax sp.]|nr:hypothetical protein [Rhodoferax sp.]